MALLACLADVLKRERMPYVAFRHPPAYTAQEEAAITHVPGRDWAKAVICFADGEPVMAVVPADLSVDLKTDTTVFFANYGLGERLDVD